MTEAFVGGRRWRRPCAHRRHPLNPHTLSSSWECVVVRSVRVGDAHIDFLRRNFSSVGKGAALRGYPFDVLVNLVFHYRHYRGISKVDRLRKISVVLFLPSSVFLPLKQDPTLNLLFDRAFEEFRDTRPNCAGEEEEEEEALKDASHMIGILARLGAVKRALAMGLGSGGPAGMRLPCPLSITHTSRSWMDPFK